MKKGRRQAVVILALALPAAIIVGWFFYFHFYLMAPRSTDPNYYSVFWLETALYYGSDCSKANLSLDSAVPGLIECREDPWLRFVNKLNGTSLRVEKAWDIHERWLPSEERVFVDYANAYVFWTKDGKVTDFVKLDPTLEAQLRRSPPEPAERSSVPGKDESQGGGVRPVQHGNGGESVTAAHARDDDVGTTHTPTPNPR